MHFLSVWWQIKKITIFKKRKLGSVLRKLPESNCWLHFVCYPFDDIYIGVLYSSWHIPRGSQELCELVDIDYFLCVNNNAQALTHTVFSSSSNKLWTIFFFRKTHRPPINLTILIVDKKTPSETFCLFRHTNVKIGDVVAHWSSNRRLRPVGPLFESISKPGTTRVKVWCP